MYCRTNQPVCIDERWKHLCTFVKEIEQFIGILWYTGIFSIQSYCIYWSNFSRFPLIADIMLRNQFQLLFRYIHFNDNTQRKPRDHPDYDSLFKVSPLLKHYEMLWHALNQKRDILWMNKSSLSKGNQD